MAASIHSSTLHSFLHQYSCRFLKLGLRWLPPTVCNMDGYLIQPHLKKTLTIPLKQKGRPTTILKCATALKQSFYHNLSKLRLKSTVDINEAHKVFVVHKSCQSIKKKQKKTVGSTAKHTSQNKIHQDLKATKHFQQQFTFKSFPCFVLKTIIMSW